MDFQASKLLLSETEFVSCAPIPQVHCVDFDLFVFLFIKRALRSRVPWYFLATLSNKSASLLSHRVFGLFAFLVHHSSTCTLLCDFFSLLILLEDDLWMTWNIRICCDEFPCVTTFGVLAQIPIWFLCLDVWSLFLACIALHWP